MGLKDPQEDQSLDPYGFAGNSRHVRSLIKRSVQILLNARMQKQAEDAILNSLPGRTIARRRAVVRYIVEYLQVQFKPIKTLWGRGVGLALQFVDSEIIRICLTKLLDRSIVGLPVHDSIIVAARHRDELIHIMDSTFANEGAKLALKRLRHFRQGGPALTVGGKHRKPCDQARAKESRFFSNGIQKKLTRAERKRVQRWENGALPTILSPDITRCWEGDDIGRTKWYEKHPDRIWRQVCSVQYALHHNMTDVLEQARINLIDAHTLREEYCTRKTLPIDELFEALDPYLLSQHPLN
ncbi:MAG: hypothetical protein AAFR90_15115 [Pseudomonadota bacterium]